MDAFAEEGDAGAPGLLLRINLQINQNLRTIVKLANSLAVALVPVVLRVYLIIDIRLQRRETVSAILAADIGLNRASARIGQVNHSIRKRIIGMIQYFARKQARVVRLRTVAKLRSRSRQHQSREQKQKRSCH